MLVVVFALAVSPAALAAPREVSTTVENFSYAFNGEGGEIGLGVTLTAGLSEAGRGYGELSLRGATEIGTARAVFDDQGMKLWLKGLEKSYTMSRSDFSLLMKTLAYSGEIPEEIDMEAFLEIFISYAQMLWEMGDAEIGARMAEEMEKAFQDLVGDAQPSEEVTEVTIMGKDVPTRRMTFAIDAKGIDRVMEAYFAASPAFRAYFENYFKLMSTAYGAPGVFTDFASVMSAMGVSLTFEVTVDATDAGDAARVEILYNIAGLDGDQEASVTLPMVIETLMDDRGTHLLMNMDMAIDGEAVEYEARIDEQDGETALDLTMGIFEDGQSVMAVNANGTYRLGTDSRETFTGRLSAEGDGAAFKGDLKYDGSYAKGEMDEKRAGHVDAVFELSAPDMENQTFEFGFDVQKDVHAGSDAMLSEMDALGGQVIVDMDESDLEKLEQEAMRIGINAVGGVLQTPGVAELIVKAGKVSPIDGAASLGMCGAY